MPATKEAEETVQLAGQPSRRRPVLILASVLALVCAGIAFTFFVIKDHGRPHLMIHDQTAPVDSHSRPGAAPSAVPQRSVGATSKSLPAAAAPTRTPFHLERNGKTTLLGPLRLRLTRTDPRAGTYDLVILSGRHSFAHRRLRQNAPVAISLGARKGSFRLVASVIDRKAIDGYWTVEPPSQTTK